MWARVVEFMLACFLAMSPFIFEYRSKSGMTFFWFHDFIFAFLIALFALLSFWQKLEKIHLLTLVVASLLIITGWGTASYQQNYLTLGLLLLMLSLIPSHSHLPPREWQDFIKE